MIFVVLGTQKFQLNRLLELMDHYITEGKLKEEVFAQIGNTDYLPKHFNYERFLDKQDFDHRINKADVVITHSGVGSIITAIKSGKPVIVFPRLLKYKEHVDNHQLDIARAFAKKEYVLCCNEHEDLYEKILQSKSFHFKPYISQREQIINIIEEYMTTSQL